MQDPVQVAVRDAAAQLVQERADSARVQTAFGAVRELFQVEVQELKNERQLLVRMHDVV